MLPLAYISHNSKGRLRFRIPSKKNDSGYFSVVYKKLRNLKFIRSLDVNLSTASILIVYVEADVTAILNYGKQQDLFEIVDQVRENPNVLSAIPETSQAEVSSQSTLIKSLVGLGFIQLLRGQILAPTSTLLMDAYRLYLTHSRLPVTPPPVTVTIQDHASHSHQALFDQQ